MFLGMVSVSGMAEYVLNMFSIFGKIPVFTECPPKLYISYGEITIVGFKPLMDTLCK